MGDSNSQVAASQGAETKGSLFLIGGAADSTLSDFVRLAGGEKAHIAILPHATSDPVGGSDYLAGRFKALGVPRTTTIMPGTNQQLPPDITAVFFTGGDQMRLVQLVDPQLLAQLRAFLQNGGLIGGTSAGAAAVPPVMIGGGMDDGIIRPGSLILAPGLGFLAGAVVDTHVGARSRDARSMAAVALLDDVLSIALDEDTAVHIAAGKGTVYGKGHVRLFRAADGHRATLVVSKDFAAASVTGVLVSFLVAGEEFAL